MFWILLGLFCHESMLLLDPGLNYFLITFCLVQQGSNYKSKMNKRLIFWLFSFTNQCFSYSNLEHYQCALCRQKFWFFFNSDISKILIVVLIIFEILLTRDCPISDQILNSPSTNDITTCKFDGHVIVKLLSFY